MSVQAVSCVNNIQQKSVQSPIETQKPNQKEKISDGTKLLLASLATLAIGGGIYFATRGRGGSSVATGSNTSSGNEKPLEILKEYTLEAFKKAGHKFEKGKAITSDGKNYTGIIEHQNGDKFKFIMEYKDGVLDKVEKFDIKSNKKYYKKLYTHQKYNARLSNIKVDDKEIFQIYGAGARTRNGSYICNHDNSIITVRHDDGSEKGYVFVNGKRILRTECTKDNPGTLIFYRDNGTKEFALQNCTTLIDTCNTGSRWNGKMEIYDENGKFIKILEILDDPKKYYEYKDIFLKWCTNMTL